MSDDLARVERALAQRIATPPTEAFMERRQGVVDTVNVSASTVDVVVGGTLIPGVRYKAWYAPSVGDVVFLEVVGTDFVVDGRIAGSTIGTSPVKLAEFVATAPVDNETLVIPQTHRHLRIVASVRDVSADVNAANLTVWFNGDFSLANYRRHFFQAVGSVVSAGNDDSADFGLVVPGGATAGRFAANDFFVPDYRASGRRHAITGTAGAVVIAGASFVGRHCHGEWSGTDPITSVTFDAASNFATDSVFTVYGLP